MAMMTRKLHLVLAMFGMVFVICPLTSEGQDSYGLLHVWPDEILGLRSPHDVAVGS